MKIFREQTPGSKRTENSESSEFKFCGARNPLISYVFTDEIATETKTYCFNNLSKATPYSLFFQ